MNESELLNDIIKNRRSVYPPAYTSEVIDDDVIEQLLENANWAPTHGLTEPWRFTVFTGEGLKALADFQAKLYKTNNGKEFDQKKYDKLLNKPLQCSHIISIGMKRGNNPKIPEIEEIEATASAVQNMQLTAHAYGLGCYWGSGGITYMEEAKEFFNLGPHDKLLGFLYLGIPKKPQKIAGRRSPIHDKVRWVR